MPAMHEVYNMRPRLTTNVSSFVYSGFQLEKLSDKMLLLEGITKNLITATGKHDSQASTTYAKVMSPVP